MVLVERGDAVVARRRKLLNKALSVSAVTPARKFCRQNVSSRAVCRYIGTQRLKKMSADLSLEKTDKLKQLTAKDMAIQAAKEAAAKGGGFNPYNSSGSGDSRPAVKHPATAHKQSDHPGKPRQSLATKYANQNRQNSRPEPRGFWARLTARLRGK